MKKTACTTFVNLLNTIHEKEITTRAALMADPPLYAEFWLALKSFCRLALLSKTSGKNAQGEPLPGNAVKIDVLEARGAAARDELETDCAIRIIEKLDLVLRQPLEKQKNYCHAICKSDKRLFPAHTQGNHICAPERNGHGDRRRSFVHL